MQADGFLVHGGLDRDENLTRPRRRDDEIPHRGEWGPAPAGLD